MARGNPFLFGHEEALSPPVLLLPATGNRVWTEIRLL
jgi:hypothetical protein